MNKKIVLSRILFVATFLIGGIGGYLVLSGKCKPYYGAVFFAFAFITYAASEFLGKYKNAAVSNWSKTFSLIHIIAIVVVVVIMLLMFIAYNT